MKMKPNLPMARWIAEVCCVSFLLAQIGGSVTEEDTIVVLANGLPPSYDNLVVNLDSTPADQILLLYVVTRLLNQESASCLLQMQPLPFLSQILPLPLLMPLLPPT